MEFKVWERQVSTSSSVSFFTAQQSEDIHDPRSLWCRKMKKNIIKISIMEPFFRHIMHVSLSPICLYSKRTVLQVIDE